MLLLLFDAAVDAADAAAVACCIPGCRCMMAFPPTICVRLSLRHRHEPWGRPLSPPYPSGWCARHGLQLTLTLDHHVGHAGLSGRQNLGRGNQSTTVPESYKRAASALLVLIVGLLSLGHGLGLRLGPGPHCWPGPGGLTIRGEPTYSETERKNFCIPTKKNLTETNEKKCMHWGDQKFRQTKNPFIQQKKWGPRKDQKFDYKQNWNIHTNIFFSKFW